MSLYTRIETFMQGRLKVQQTVARNKHAILTSLETSALNSDLSN